jgi:hypothetical protein
MVVGRAASSMNNSLGFKSSKNGISGVFNQKSMEIN